MGSVCDEILRESTGPIEETLFSPLASSNVKFPTAAGTCEFRLGRRGDARVLLRIQGGREEVLTSSVQRVFRSEAPNAMDDNRNGVIDEGGFWVTSRGNGSVSIGLSLAQLHGDQLVSTSRQVTITPGAPDGW